MTDKDILDMMAKAKATKKKTAKKKVSKKVAAKKDEVIRIPDKPKTPTLKATPVDADRKKVEDTLKEYELESNIPVPHPYWKACGRIRMRTRR